MKFVPEFPNNKERRTHLRNKPDEGKFTSDNRNIIVVVRTIRTEAPVASSSIEATVSPNLHKRYAYNNASKSTLLLYRKRWSLCRIFLRRLLTLLGPPGGLSLLFFLLLFLSFIKLNGQSKEILSFFEEATGCTVCSRPFIITFLCRLHCS